MGYLQQVDFAAAPKTNSDWNTMADSAENLRRSRAMLSGWRLDAADDPTILFSNIPVRQPDRSPVAEANESDEWLWARHQAWQM
ncbi:MAG TPA: hypothetical protein VGX76_25090 [Pirellulales bacterium]|jgi:hypothetical protein|nr:hypothetical protein [Pirellulales bacterium]